MVLNNFTSHAPADVREQYNRRATVTVGMMWNKTSTLTTNRIIIICSASSKLQGYKQSKGIM